MPETFKSFHYLRPAPRWRLLPWLGNPGNPATSPHAAQETGMCHTDKKKEEKAMQFKSYENGASLITCRCALSFVCQH